MTGLEVCLIIIGFICICASFFVSRRGAGEETEISAAGGGPAAEVWTEKDEQIVRQRLEEILNELQTEYVEDAKGQMGAVCNEKIMAVDEFSSQILEKINSNHQEVVFMYNMLSEKQKELKTLMSETVKPVREKESEIPAKTATPADTVVARKPQKTGTQAKSLQTSKKPAAPTGLAQVKKTTSRQEISKTADRQKKPQEMIKKEQKQPENSVPGNVNLQIQKMYKEGKSVLEISKALDIGQGEVKLVIALYGGRKK